MTTEEQTKNTETTTTAREGTNVDAATNMSTTTEDAGDGSTTTTPGNQNNNKSTSDANDPPLPTSSEDATITNGSTNSNITSTDTDMTTTIDSSSNAVAAAAPNEAKAGANLAEHGSTAGDGAAKMDQTQQQSQPNNNKKDETVPITSVEAEKKESAVVVTNATTTTTEKKKTKDKDEPPKKKDETTKTDTSDVVEDDHGSIDEYSDYSGTSHNAKTTASHNKKIRLGICAMDKKARSKPMAEILSRLDPTQFDIVFYGDDLLLNAPIEEWPVVDALIAFHSTGYPLAKAEAYASLHKPFLLNDLRMQRVLMDRRKVYEKCVEAGIDVPRHVFMSRDGYVKSKEYYRRMTKEHERTANAKKEKDSSSSSNKPPTGGGGGKHKKSVSTVIPHIPSCSPTGRQDSISGGLGADLSESKSDGGGATINQTSTNTKPSSKGDTASTGEGTGGPTTTSSTAKDTDGADTTTNADTGTGTGTGGSKTITAEGVGGEVTGDNDEEECFTKDVDVFIEHDDSIEVNGIVIRKPFVEKPVDADDHNIRIYYPSSAGGGCKMLFRKIGDRSSAFNPDISSVRKEGSYIYEEFVETQGTDVKMYTVGPDYGHAEARKSPTMDGIVIRDENGKEVRYPVILSFREKEIARRIVLIFKQMVCGFDLLRVQEGDSLISFVCDVNGWSFVKNSRKYYEDCAQILTEHMLAACKPRSFLRLSGFSAINPLLTHHCAGGGGTIGSMGAGPNSHHHHGPHGHHHHHHRTIGTSNTTNKQETALQRATRMISNLTSPKKDSSKNKSMSASASASAVASCPLPSLFTAPDSTSGELPQTIVVSNNTNGLVSDKHTAMEVDEHGEPLPYLSERSANLAVRESLEPNAPPIRDFEHRLLADPPTLEDRSVTSQSTLASTTGVGGNTGTIPPSSISPPPPSAGGEWFSSANSAPSGAVKGGYNLSRQSSSTTNHGGVCGTTTTPTAAGVPTAFEDPTELDDEQELRCVIAIVRHGDRTPKQKLKVTTSEPLVLKYFEDHCDDHKVDKELKVKDRKPMVEFLQCLKTMIAQKEAIKKLPQINENEGTSSGSGTEPTTPTASTATIPEEKTVVAVEQPQPPQEGDTTAAKKKKKKKEGAGEMSLYNLYHMRDVLERWKIEGLNRKLQIKPRKWAEMDEILETGEEEEVDDGNDNDDDNAVHEEKGIEGEGSTLTTKRKKKKVVMIQKKKVATEVQLILKWGGNLTKLGEKQSTTLGEKFRHDMYPDTPGGGILRLHSTFRHDLKIKTSDEGRVMKTAAAFAKGLLELEGEIAPILVALVHKEKDSMHMLDPSGNEEVKAELEECKKRIKRNLQTDINVSEATVEERERLVGSSELTSIHDSLERVKNPRQCLFQILHQIRSLLDEFEDMLDIMTSEDEGRRIEGGEGLRSGNEGEDALSGVKLYKGETLLELTERWRNLYDKLYDEEKDTFDLSRIPDVHDNVRFDMLHNPHLGLTPKLQKLYKLAADMAGCVVPQEYGVSIQEKRDIGNKMCRALLEKIKYDLIIARTDNQVDMRYMINMDYSSDLPINTLGRRVRTRLYFTSESHLHTVANVLRFPATRQSQYPSPLSKYGKDVVASSPELCYLTQIIFRLFEDRNRALDDPQRFRVEILFSPGATATPHHMSELEKENDQSRFDTQELEVVSEESLTCDAVEKYFMEAIKAADAGAGMVATASGTEEEHQISSSSSSIQQQVDQTSAATADESTKHNVSDNNPEDTQNDNIMNEASGGDESVSSFKDVVVDNTAPTSTNNHDTDMINMNTPHRNKKKEDNAEDAISNHDQNEDEHQNSHSSTDHDSSVSKTESFASSVGGGENNHHQNKSAVEGTPICSNRQVIGYNEDTAMTCSKETNLVVAGSDGKSNKVPVPAPFCGGDDDNNSKELTIKEEATSSKDGGSDNSDTKKSNDHQRSSNNANVKDKEEEGTKKKKKLQPHLTNTEEDEERRVRMVAKLIARRYLWRGIAAGCFVLGAGCIFMARRIQMDYHSRQRRWG